MTVGENFEGNQASRAFENYLQAVKSKIPRLNEGDFSKMTDEQLKAFMQAMRDLNDAREQTANSANSVVAGL